MGSMGYMPEPEELEISFERPQIQVRPKSRIWKWEKLLRKVKAAPGCEARIRVHESRYSANAEIRRIKDRLDQVAPFEDWEFHNYAYTDEEHRAWWGVYATYHGMMSQAERNKRTMEAKIRSDRRKASWAKKKIKDEMENLGHADIMDLTRARLGRR
jgi:hypothetical protein